MQLVHGFSAQELQKLVEFGVKVFATWELGADAIFWDCVWATPEGNVRMDGATFLKFVMPPSCSDFAKRAVLIFDGVLFVEFPASHVCDDRGDGVIAGSVRAIVGERIVGSGVDVRSYFGPIVVECQCHKETGLAKFTAHCEHVQQARFPV